MLYLARNLDIGLENLRPGGNADAAAFESIVLELQRSLDYFESNFGMAAITRVLAHPQTDSVDALLAHVQRTLPSLQTATFQPGEAFHAPVKVPPGCLNAFGAALRQEAVA